MTRPTRHDPAAPLEPRPRVMTSRNVLFYLAARFFWTAAFQICNVAVAWLVYDVTRSAWALGLVGLAAFAPKLVVTFVSGLVADRFDRRLIVSISLLVNALSTVGLVLVVLADPVPLWAVYVLFVTSATARGFANPAISALGANLVAREDLARVFSLAMSVTELPRDGQALHVQALRLVEVAPRKCDVAEVVERASLTPSISTLLEILQSSSIVPSSGVCPARQCSGITQFHLIPWIELMARILDILSIGENRVEFGLGLLIDLCRLSFAGAAEL